MNHENVTIFTKIITHNFPNVRHESSRITVVNRQYKSVIFAHVPNNKCPPFVRKHFFPSARADPRPAEQRAIDNGKENKCLKWLFFDFPRRRPRQGFSGGRWAGLFSEGRVGGFPSEVRELSNLGVGPLAP